MCWTFQSSNHLPIFFLFVSCVLFWHGPSLCVGREDEDGCCEESSHVEPANKRSNNNGSDDAHILQVLFDTAGLKRLVVK